MSMPDVGEPKPTLQSLQAEIDRLTELQKKVLALAVYIGMSADEEREYDKRRKRILELVEQRDKFSVGEQRS